MNFVTFIEQEFSQIAAVLAGNSCDQRNGLGHCRSLAKTKVFWNLRGIAFANFEEVRIDAFASRVKEQRWDHTRSAKFFRFAKLTKNSRKPVSSLCHNGHK